MADNWFNGDHPRVGDWESLEGMALGVHMQEPIAGQNGGGNRPQGEVAGAGSWESLLMPTVAPTRGGGAMAK